jgi:hypothetical protein
MENFVVHYGTGRDSLGAMWGTQLANAPPPPSRRGFSETPIARRETPWSPLNPMLTDPRITETQLRGRIKHLHRDADAEKMERIFAQVMNLRRIRGAEITSATRAASQSQARVQFDHPPVRKSRKRKEGEAGTARRGVRKRQRAKTAEAGTLSQVSTPSRGTIKGAVWNAQGFAKNYMDWAVPASPVVTSTEVLQTSVASERISKQDLP